MNKKKQKRAAQALAEHRNDRGYEKCESGKSRTDLLQNVPGADI